MSNAQGGDVRVSRRWAAGLLFGTLFVFGILLLAASSVRNPGLPDGTTSISVTTTHSTQLNPRGPNAPDNVKAPFVGNTKSYKFHKKGCRYFTCTNCTARFNTREEAIAAGYRPCGTCDP
jgi:hypothetical protein